MKECILIVEDDSSISNMIAEVLKKEGFDCVQAYSGTEAMFNVKAQVFDLILLDLMLPGMSGEEFLQTFRRQYSIPVIVLSAKDELDTKVDMLTKGADDYLTKPFEIKELVARILVQLRHSTQSVQDTESDIIIHKKLTLNRATFEVKVAEQPINLTKQEFKILELLLSHPNKVFSKQDIYDYAWEDYFIGEDKTINVHISNIRLKIKKYTDEDYIDTVWGIGFKLSK